MNSNPKLKELVCSSSNNAHLVRDPVALECGHGFCSECLDKDTKSKTIKCIKCNKVCLKGCSNRYNFKFPRTLLSDLFLELEKQTLEKLNEFKGLLESCNQTADVHFQYVQEEIEIRVESIKIQLEEHLDKFKNDLQKMKDDFKSRNAANFETMSVKSFENSFSILQYYCKGKEIQNIDKFHQFQENYKKLKEKVKQFEDDLCNFQLTFKPSNDSIAEGLVGSVSFSSKPLRRNCSERRIELLRGEQLLATIQFNKNIREICSMPNQQFLFATEDSLRIYDNNFKMIKEVSEHRIYANGIAISYQNERIYVSSNSWTIIMMDFRLNILKTVKLHDWHPVFHGMCYKNDFLYVCDKRCKRVRIYDQEMRDIQIYIKVDYTPYYVKASDHVLAVSGNVGLHFYDLGKLKLKTKYSSICGHVTCDDNSQFYILDTRTKKSHVFDSLGVRIETIDHTWFNFRSNFTYELQALFVGEHLYINCYSERQILEF